jgi:hypothetical protein
MKHQLPLNSRKSHFKRKTPPQKKILPLALVFKNSFENSMQRQLQSFERGLAIVQALLLDSKEQGPYALG